LEFVLNGSASHQRQVAFHCVGNLFDFLLAIFEGRGSLAIGLLELLVLRLRQFFFAQRQRTQALHKQAMRDLVLVASHG